MGNKLMLPGAGQEEIPSSEGLCRAVGGMHRGQEGDKVILGGGF